MDQAVTTANASATEREHTTSNRTVEKASEHVSGNVYSRMRLTHRRERDDFVIPYHLHHYLPSNHELPISKCSLAEEAPQCSTSYTCNGNCTPSFWLHTENPEAACAHCRMSNPTRPFANLVVLLPCFLLLSN